MSKPAPDRKILLTQLANTTGRNVAIFLQELHYATKSQHKQVWRGSYEYWQREHFPFWSTDTTERTIRKAELMGLVYSKIEHRAWTDKTKRTKSYGINYDMVSTVENQTGTLLLDDTPLSFSASVAALFAQTPGLTLNDAFVLFEIRYWMKVEEKKYQKFKSKNTHHNSFWDLKRISDLNKRLPFMCRRTIERSIKRLRDNGYIKTEVTRNQTLAFTIVADKVNTIEGIAEELKVLEPPKLTGNTKTKFYASEYKIQGTNDLWYIVRSFQQLNQDDYDGLIGLDEKNNVDHLHAIVAKIGKHKFMEDLRDVDYSSLFIEKDWSEYLDMAKDRLAHTMTCANCRLGYDVRYGCICGGTEDEEELIYGNNLSPGYI